MNLMTSGLCFNPRTREGATCGYSPDKVVECSFNPRTREGATDTYRITDEEIDVSIHAPVKVRLCHRPH